ncbi:hypothetical protein FSP39_018220 [Pinctada imbricata]|uniref:Death domain-containing protein n=1 Tax=Pinctada imbricata TaxID=66713 RepID=A0AA88YV15_PINIB|nr:hypothetical protein FSP39_018220 [Pinctada imbricata]
MVDDEDLYPGKSQHRRMIDFLEYWIAMIITYAGSEQKHFPRIILIGTHKDQIKEEVGFDDQDQQSCTCEEYEKYPLEDVNLMRIAQKLRRINLSIPMLCTVILNDAQYSSQVEEDFKGFHGDVKAFYVLKRWKQTTQNYGVKGLKNLLKDHIHISNAHMLCQAMQSEVRCDRAFASTNSVLTVYDEFLCITADRVGYEFMQLGLELGLSLAEIERLQMEKGNTILQISRSMLMKWYNKNKEDATFLKLAMAFMRCGIQNLEWMDMEFDVEKSKASGAKSCTIS